MISNLISLLKPKNNEYFRTFSYYIPAPPKRKKGYQEKEFDQIINYISENGFTVHDIKLSGHSDPDSPGIWAICLISTHEEEKLSLLANLNYEAITRAVSQEIPTDPSIQYE